MPSSVYLAPSLWRCPACLATIGSTYTFSTSSIIRGIAPESPRYIDVPKPPQQTYPSRLRIKGSLPVPRDIFDKRSGGVEKVTTKYLDAMTQERTRQPVGPFEYDASENAWRLRMASKRRQNLREGLIELQDRRRQTDQFVAERSARRQAEHQRLLDQKPREDERLTSPTVIPLMKAFQKGHHIPDPNREERLAKMRQRVDAKDAQRAEARRNALHSLYMQARSFIITEDQLEAHIDKEFEDPSWKAKGSSIWRAGAPETIQQMLDRANMARTGTFRDSEVGPKVHRDRIQRITEALTGGKM